MVIIAFEQKGDLGHGQVPVTCFSEGVWYFIVPLLLNLMFSFFATTARPFARIPASLAIHACACPPVNLPNAQYQLFWTSLLFCNGLEWDAQISGRTCAVASIVSARRFSTLFGVYPDTEWGALKKGVGFGMKSQCKKLHDLTAKSLSFGYKDHKKKTGKNNTVQKQGMEQNGQAEW